MSDLGAELTTEQVRLLAQLYAVPLDDQLLGPLTGFLSELRRSLRQLDVLDEQPPGLAASPQPAFRASWSA